MITQSGDVTEHNQTLTDPIERNTRDQAIRANLSESKARHHEVVAEAELNVTYEGSPIVTGDVDSHLAPGRRLPNTITVKPPNRPVCRLHELTHRTSHTALLFGGTTVRGHALAEILTALKDLATGSPLFDAAFAFSASSDREDSIGHLEPTAAELLGIQGITLLMVRPDGYIGLRADRDHLKALERYHATISGRYPQNSDDEKE
jgi:hypothetical protein